MQLIYKQKGETPLEALDRLREERPELADATLSYAGRLDPMAEGLLLVLVGEEENQNREVYLNLDKTYEFAVLFGITTDSFDTLGLVQDVCKNGVLTDGQIDKLCERVEGIRQMRYPPFSSATVEGKQLWQWAREGRIDEVEIPMRPVEIHDIEPIDRDSISSENILKQVSARVGEVSGDFRQEAIIDSWENALREREDQRFPLVSFRLACGSGTYVRRIAQLMGEWVGCGGTAWRITRTRIGEHTLEDL